MTYFMKYGFNRLDIGILLFVTFALLRLTFWVDIPNKKVGDKMNEVSIKGNYVLRVYKKIGIFLFPKKKKKKVFFLGLSLDEELFS